MPSGVDANMGSTQQIDRGDSRGDGDVPVSMASANELDLLDMVDENEQFEIVCSFASNKHIVRYMRPGE